MTKLWKSAAIALLATLTLSPLASAQQHRVPVRRQVVIYYHPFYWDHWGPGYYPYRSAYFYPTTGDVQLKTDLKRATVFVDGGLVGRVDKNKRITLPPGTHNVELRDIEGRVIFAQRVQVLLGKTTKLDLRDQVG